MGILTVKDEEMNGGRFYKNPVWGDGGGDRWVLCCYLWNAHFVPAVGELFKHAGTQWGPRGQGYLRFLGKQQSGQITPKTNKSRALMMSLSLDWMVSLFPQYIATNQVYFQYCPCRFNLRTLDTTLLFCFKHIKTAPDTSIPTRGIEKHLGCRLPGLPPRMSASDEGEKNDAL